MSAPSVRRAAFSGRPLGGGSLLRSGDCCSAVDEEPVIGLGSLLGVVAFASDVDFSVLSGEPRSNTLRPSVVPLMASMRRSFRDFCGSEAVAGKTSRAATSTEPVAKKVFIARKAATRVGSGA